MLTTIIAGLDAAAQVLGITPDDLSAGFQSGKNLAQLANECGVDLAVLQQMIREAMLAEPIAAVRRAVIDGRLTQANADWLLQGLDKGYWGAGNIVEAGFRQGNAGLYRWGESSSTPSNRHAVSNAA